MASTHFHQRFVFILLAAVTTWLSLSPSISAGGQTDSPDKAVRHLLEYVARSELTFIRNSRQYTAQEAAEHMRKKYQHFRDEIGVPEQFIELCATRSLISGKPYLVINKQGKTIRTSEWLTAELKAYRKHAAVRSD